MLKVRESRRKGARAWQDHFIETLLSQDCPGSFKQSLKSPTIFTQVILKLLWTCMSKATIAKRSSRRHCQAHVPSATDRRPSRPTTTTAMLRADLAPEKLYAHLVAYGAFLRSGEGVNLCREVPAEETKSLILLLIAAYVVRESTSRLRGLSFVLKIPPSEHLDIARSRVPSSAGKCARRITGRMCVRGHRNRSARTFVNRQSVRCAFSVKLCSFSRRR